MSSKMLKKLPQTVISSGAWQKLANPGANRGGTEWPKKPADLERIGVRFDYGGEVTIDGVVHHKYQVQPNAGKIPSSLKKIRDESKKGTHARDNDRLCAERRDEGGGRRSSQERDRE